MSPLSVTDWGCISESREGDGDDLDAACDDLVCRVAFCSMSLSAKGSEVSWK